MKIKNIVLGIFLFLIFFLERTFSQCACMGGASIGGLTQFTGSDNMGVLKKGNMRFSTFYNYTYGNDYYMGDTKTSTGPVKEFNASFLGFNLGYGINEDLTIEAELYSYPEKLQDFYDYKLSGSGLSHITLNLKYNLIKLRSKEIEWSIGLGGKIPVQTGNDNLPQNIQASTGAFGFVFQSFLHKGFKNEGLHFILASRIENNYENKNEYQYGFSFINSLICTKTIINNLTGIIEIRNDIRTKDKRYGSYVNDSGGNTIIISPQIAYKVGDFNLLILYDYPVYKYYFGKQLTKDYSIGAALTWQTNLVRN